MAWRPQIVKREPSALVSGEAEFLASENFVTKRVGVTIDSDTVTEDADGHKIINKGTVLGRISSTGLYGPYDNAASDGREEAKGFLVEGVDVRWGDVTAGMVISGSVVADRCSGLDASGKADLTAVTFQ